MIDFDSAFIIDVRENKPNNGFYVKHMSGENYIL